MTETKKRAAAGTVKMKEITDDVISRMKKIDSNKEYDQSEKTRRWKALAESIKNKLHEDGRKKAENKVANSTYRRYLTDIRRAITDQNWHHHALDKKLDLMARRYPKYESEIKTLRCKKVTDTREAHKALLDKMLENGDGTIHDQVELLSVNHEILRWLVMESSQKKELKKKEEEALSAKKNATIDVDYQWLMATIENLLTPDTSKNISFSRLALGIAFATGRRAVEVVYQGKFSKAGEYELDFTGTAKKRGGADYSKSYRIYSLVPADQLLAAFALLKQQPEIQALSELDDIPENQRNVAVNHKMGKTLNTTAKRVWMDDNRVFKDSRAIWARLVFEEHFKTDKRWAKVDEDVFWHEMLCHEDIETQKAYKQFKIFNQDGSQTASAPQGRLECVKALMNEPAIQSRGALLKITTWAIEEIEKDPLVSITQHKIISEVGSGRKVIKDWLTIATPALEVETISVKPKEEPAKKEEVKTVKVEVKKTEKPAQKPRLSAVEIRAGIWDVNIKIGDTDNKYLIRSETKPEALQQAWTSYINESASTTA